MSKRVPRYSEEVSDPRLSARRCIVVGYALSALGTLVDVVALIHSGYLGQGSFRADIQLIALTLASVASLWTWWILSKVASFVTEFNAALRSAFLGMMVVSLCLCVEYANYLWNSPGLDQFTSSVWLQEVGSCVTAVGFFLLARSFSGDAHRAEEPQRTVSEA